jgi:hypothetical protein
MSRKIAGGLVIVAIFALLAAGPIFGLCTLFYASAHDGRGITQIQGWVLIALLAYSAFFGSHHVLIELAAIKELLTEVRETFRGARFDEMRDSLHCIETDSAQNRPKFASRTTRWSSNSISSFKFGKS